VYDGDANVYSNANLTDDVAEEYLRKNPNAIRKFAAYPDDWQDVKRASKKADKGDADLKAELKEAKRVIKEHLAKIEELEATIVELNARDAEHLAKIEELKGLLKEPEEKAE
jgi:chromosome segregation ATPase